MDGVSVENWKPVVGYEGLYEVSDLGRVRHVNLTILRTFLRGKANSGKYLAVSLALQGTHKSHLIHRLVLAAFVGPSNGLQTDHIDCNKQNNKLSNLEYVTGAENARRANKLGLYARANRLRSHVRHRPTALKPDEVIAIRLAAKEIEAGKSQQTFEGLGRQFSLSSTAILKIRKGLTWKRLLPASA